MQEQPQNELSLQETFQQIEEIVAKLEQQDVGLEESFTYFDQGMRLLQECNDKIDRVEKQVLELTENGVTRGFE